MQRKLCENARDLTEAVCLHQNDVYAKSIAHKLAHAKMLQAIYLQF